MTHGTAFAVLPDLTSAFNDPGTANALKVTIDIEKESFTLAGRVERSSPPSDASGFASMKSSFLTEHDACFVLYRDASDVWSLYSYIPDTAAVKSKMLYASSRAPLLKALGGEQKIPREANWTELSEAKFDDGTAQSCDDRKAEEHDLMTEVERLKIQADQQQAIEAAGDKISSGGLALPTTPEASTALSGFKDGSLGVLVLAISGETVGLKASAAAATPTELQGHIPKGDACYCLYRWAHERNGESKSSVLFLYMCAEEAPVRTKMLHASTKGPFLSSLASMGLEVVKAIEGLETSELTDAELTGQVYAAEAAAAQAAAAQPTITKAAPKGGRKLVKRAKPVDVE